MSLRQSATLGCALILSFCFGCGKSDSTPNAPATSNALSTSNAAVHAAPVMKPVVRVHWIGKKAIATDTNAVDLLHVWSMPETLALQRQTFDKLAAAPWSFLRHQSNPASTNLLRPLLQDIVDEESYIEIAASADDTNQREEMVLAIRLNGERAGLWQTNVAAALQSLTGIPLTNSSPRHWVLRKHHAPNVIELVQAGDWTLLAAAQDHNALLDETLARVQSGQPPFATETTNSWLEANLDLPRLVNRLHGTSNIAAQLPEISLVALGSDGYVHTRGDLTFTDGRSASVEPWNIPTNLIDGDVMSFTAIRGLRSWPVFSENWSSLQAGPPPDQLFVWALRSFPMETYFASPLPDATNTVALISALILKKGGPWFATNSWASFQKSTNGIAWRGLPYMSPFLMSRHVNGSDFAFGGGFRPEQPTRPLRPALLKEVQDQTNLVYYDWELTGARVEQLVYLGQLIRFISARAQLPIDSNSILWLKAIAPALGNCVTKTTQTDPARFSFVRSSTIGFSGVEIHLLVDWLESPDFPFGLHSSLPPPPDE